jgi:hypothetical protein
MKCELCYNTSREIIIVQRRFINRGILEGYICKTCYKNFQRFPNKIVYDGIKWWYISDPNLFPDNWKLTFHYADKAAFREFNGKNRIFTIWNAKLGWIKVSYYWVIKKGGIKKGPYFWDSGDPKIFKIPREIKEKIKEMEKV